MKKLLKEGRTDFNHVKSIAEILILLIILSGDNFSQVPINGFCKYQAFETDSGYQKLLPLNFNDDSYTDLCMYSPAADTFISVQGRQNGKFGSPLKNKIPQTFSDVQYLWNQRNKIYAYAFISRKQSAAGILKFNTEGSPEIESIFKFNTYPEHLSTGDVNDDGIPELLVSGSAFNGLSIVYQEKKLREKKIAEKTSYSEAIFADLNNDGYPDIAALEIFTNRLQFFYNNSKGNFSRVREIPFSKPVTMLQSTDLDLDSYADLICCTDNSIEVDYGDFSSSYEDTLVITTKYRIDKLITGDFNRDGKIDFAYISGADGVLSLIFAEDERKFYPELIYFKKDTLSDIIPYYSKFVNGIAAADSRGKYYLISNLSSITDGVSMISGANPTSVSYFDKDNNGINDLCFIDGYNKTLNLILRNNSGVPNIWVPFPLFESESVVTVDNKLPQEKSFYCYSRGKKLIEIINVDFKKNEYERKSVYSPGEIKDIKIEESTGKIYSAFTKDKNLGVTVFTDNQSGYTSNTLSGIRSNVSDAALAVNHKPRVYYSTFDDTIMIGERVVEPNQKNTEFKTNFTRDYKILLTAGNFLGEDNPGLYGFLSSENKSSMIFLAAGEVYIVSGKQSELSGLRIKDKNQLFFGELRFNGPGRVCYYNPANSTVKYLEPADGNGKLLRNLLMENVNSRSFFVKNMNTRKFHIVYINNTENCITIRELK